MPLLEIANLSVRFGGLRALTDFSLSIDAGELVGLIGPNGAGKTTAFNVVTGVYAPSSGTVTLGGKRIDGSTPVKINHAGLARTFQNIRLFGEMTVLDNVIVGYNRSAEHGFLGTIVRSPKFRREQSQMRERGMALLETLGLAGKDRLLARNLPYGDQRKLEIARALATGPKILLLDEPAAGMNPSEKVELTGLIKQIRQQFGVGIWLIEHDMRLVMSICERVTVLDHGDIIAAGTPRQVQANPKVIEAYLGEPLPA